MKILLISLLLTASAVQAKDNFDWLNWMIITGQFNTYPRQGQSVSPKYERPPAKPACEDEQLKQLGIIVECPKKEEVKK